MFAWRRAVSAIVIALFALALGVSAHAQLGSLLKKAIPKPASPVAPPPPARKLYCEGITPEMVDQLLKGLKGERAAHEKAQAMENAAKAAQDKNAQASAARMMAAMEKQSACEQAAMEKDPRYKEIVRLTDLRNKAQDRGDEAAADKYGEQFAALNDEVEKTAKKACISGACIAKAKEESAHQQNLAEARAAAAKEKNPDLKANYDAQVAMFLAMIDGEAEMKCGAMGAGLPSADEQAATDAAAAAAKKARDGTAPAGAEAAGLTEDEYGRLIECTRGALNNAAATPLTDDSKKNINQRSPDLESALKAAGR